MFIRTWFVLQKIFEFQNATNSYCWKRETNASGKDTSYELPYRPFVATNESSSGIPGDPVHIPHIPGASGRSPAASLSVPEGHDSRGLEWVRRGILQD